MIRRMMAFDKKYLVVKKNKNDEMEVIDIINARNWKQADSICYAQGYNGQYIEAEVEEIFIDAGIFPANDQDLFFYRKVRQSPDTFKH